MFVFEVYFTPIEIQSCSTLDDTFVVEQRNERINRGLCDFGGGFVGEVEFNFDLAAVWLFDKHIILG